MENLFISLERNIFNIELDNVCYFCANSGKILIYMDDNRLFKISKQSLDYLDGITNDNFFRSHRSYLINIKKINCITKFNFKSYNVSFKDISSEAYMTQKRFNLLNNKIHLI